MPSSEDDATMRLRSGRKRVRQESPPTRLRGRGRARGRPRTARMSTGRNRPQQLYQQAQVAYMDPLPLAPETVVESRTQLEAGFSDASLSSQEDIEGQVHVVVGEPGGHHARTPSADAATNIPSPSTVGTHGDGQDSSNDELNERLDQNPLLNDQALDPLVHAMEEARIVYDTTMNTILINVQRGLQPQIIPVSVPEILMATKAIPELNIKDVGPTTSTSIVSATPPTGLSPSTVPMRKTVVCLIFNNVVGYDHTRLVITVHLPVQLPLPLGAVVDAVDQEAETGENGELAAYWRATQEDAGQITVTTANTMANTTRSERCIIGPASLLPTLGTCPLNPATGDEVDDLLIEMGLAAIWTDPETGEEEVHADAEVYILTFEKQPIVKPTGKGKQRGTMPTGGPSSGFHEPQGTAAASVRVSTSNISTNSSRDFTANLSLQEVAAYLYLDRIYGNIPYDIQRLSDQARCYKPANPLHFTCIMRKIEPVLVGEGFDMGDYAFQQLPKQVVNKPDFALTLGLILGWAYSRVGKAPAAEGWRQSRSKISRLVKSIQLHKGELAALSAIIHSYLEPPPSIAIQIGQIQDVMTVITVTIEASIDIYSAPFSSLNQLELQALQWSWTRLARAGQLVNRLADVYALAMALEQEIRLFRRDGIPRPSSPDVLFQKLNDLAKLAENILNPDANLSFLQNDSDED